MTAADHPLLRHAGPETRGIMAERLGLPPHPDPGPPATGDPHDVIALLRSGRGKDPRYVLDGVAVVDWDLIVSEHRRAPLPDAIGAGLVARIDCPPWAALHLVVAHSTNRRGLGTATLAAALRRGVLTPRQVMFEAAPGWSALRVLEKYATAYGEWLHPIRRVLEDAAALLPGDDIAAWWWLLDQGPLFRGTFPELCAAAVAVGEAAGRGPGNAASHAPAESGRSAPRKPVTAPPFPPTSVHRDLANPSGLLARARGDIAARLIAAMPVPLVSTFLETPALPAKVVVPALRRAPKLTAQLVRQADRSPGTLGALLGLRDAEVNSALLTEVPDRPELAYAVFRATRRDGNRAVPLTPDARSEIQHAADAGSKPHGAAVHGHCPQLIRATFEQFGTRLGTAMTLRGLLSLWECQTTGALVAEVLAADETATAGPPRPHPTASAHPGGPSPRGANPHSPQPRSPHSRSPQPRSPHPGAAAARPGTARPGARQVPRARKGGSDRPVHLDEAAAALARQALASPDGYAALRDAVARHERPEALIVAMRREPALAAHPLPDDFWPFAVAEHARDPLPEPVLRELASRATCPDPLALDACRLCPDLAHQLGGRSRAYALTAARHPLHLQPSAWQTPRNAWYLTALDEGSLTPAEFVELTGPVRTMFEALGDVRAVLPEAHAAALEHAGRLVARTLGDDPEAWTVAVHLFPGFVGNLPELLATVAAVAS
ncbi:hypothetical protein [Yinghuangia sp. YIM S09857]|uniref:hypothetical protein n=1 Tax=Yinghuangia sp. YIM S09857 TaxID=3436929 RepID=UPI003F532835